MNISIGHVSSMVFSYLAHRATIGLLGMVLPFVVALGAWFLFQTGIQDSISDYYHTGMRDVFVGILFVIGFFLLSYKGFDRQDDVAGNLACVFAIGVALFPTTPNSVKLASGIQPGGIAHLIFAALFFVTLAYFSLFLFTKTDPSKKPTERKLQRNRVYKTCGYIMFACIVLAAVFDLLPDNIQKPIAAYKPVFWLEAVAILAFGVSWFTKGEAILKDE